MLVDINLTKPLTFGKLRELINTGELSKFPDTTIINMCIDTYKNNVKNRIEEPCSPILSISGDTETISFYNYK